jgi:hypothetical protein
MRDPAAAARGGFAPASAVRPGAYVAFKHTTSGNAKMAMYPMPSTPFTRPAFLLLAFAAALCSGWPAPLRAASPEVLYPAVRIAHQGWSRVAISGDTLVFSDSRTPDEANGRAWVYRRSGGSWELEAVLRPPRSLPVDAAFGWTVAISADSIAVAAPPYVVYLFVRQAPGIWEQQAAIPVPPSQSAPNFGQALAMSGDSLLVGAPSAATSGSSGGAAYLYNRAGDTWHLNGTFFDSDDNFYGSQIALAGPLAVVAGGERLDTFLAGAHGWERQAMLPVSTLITGVALAGDTLAVGAFREGTSFWRFHDGGWTLASTLPAVSAPLAMDGDLLAALTASGTVQVYRQAAQASWLLVATLAEPRADQAPGFPVSVALSGGIVAASSYDPVWLFDLGN